MAPYEGRTSEQGFCAIIKPMGTISPSFTGHRCSFHPDRQDPYLRLGTVTVFVRDQDRSLRYFLDQLGFRLAIDTCLPSGDRLLVVTRAASSACPDDG